MSTRFRGRECLCIYVARRINADKVRRVLSDLINLHGAPGHSRSDNGPEFIEVKPQAWLKDNQIDTRYIDPGRPWQNGYIESFNARLREACLNREQQWTLTEARVVLKDWRWKYNHVRPHRSLGDITPLAFAQKEAPGAESTPCRCSPVGLGPPCAPAWNSSTIWNNSFTPPG